jgi:hypothetical protein
MLRENPLRGYEQFLMPTAKAAKRKHAPARRKTPRKATPRTRGTIATECLLSNVPTEAAAAAQRIEASGGALLGWGCVYLGAFVVARINPLRWIKDEPRRSRRCCRPCSSVPRASTSRRSGNRTWRAPAVRWMRMGR